MSYRTTTIALLCCSIASSAYGQQGRGTIQGTVTDTSGAAVVGAKVVLNHTDTRTVFTAATNETGFYTAPGMAVGDYTVTVAQQGFKTTVRGGIRLQVDQRARVDLILEVGLVAESVEVTSPAPLVDTSSATIGKVVENRRVRELPLNGRNALALVMLAPGVKSNAGPTNSGFADRGTALTTISINGSPSGFNAFILDGGNNNQSYDGDININPTVDAVEEFKVQTNTMSAEFGFTTGGVVNIVTKSGTNQVHGTLTEFLRNDKFDARNAFAAAKGPFRYNQFGGTVGGPVVRDRTFFFLNYEEWRYRRQDVRILSVPTVAQRNGDFSGLRDSTGALIPIYDTGTTRPNPDGAGFVRTAFAGNRIPSNQLDPVAVKMLPYFPEPNQAPSDPFTNSNNFITNIGEQRSMRQFSTKGDHRFSDRNQFFARYAQVRHFMDGGVGGAPWPDPDTRLRLDNMRTKNLLLSDTHSFSPRLLNELRLGVARQTFTFQANSFGKDLPRKLGLPAIVPPDVIPNAQITGLPNFSTQTVGTRATLTWQLFEMLTLIRGNHTLKFGGDFRIQRANDFSTRNASGIYRFTPAMTGNPQRQAGTGSGFAAFLLGVVETGSTQTAAGQAQHGYSDSFFLQDDWKVSRRLALNLGLRYDFQPWAVERYNGLSSFDPSETNPANGLRGRMEYAGIDFGRTMLQNDRNDFGPRVGFAYDLFGAAKSVIRGGYGIFYSQSFYQHTFGNSAGFKTADTNYLQPGGNTNLPAFQFSAGFPSAPVQPLGSKLGPSAFLGDAVAFDQAEARTPMSQQWNLSIQQALWGGWLVDATYTANRGTHLVSQSYDFNQLDPRFLDLGLGLQDRVANPYAGIVPGGLGAATIARSQALRPFPYYSTISVNNPHLGNSTYHAFLLSVEKRLSAGAVFLASYTNAKLISDSVKVPLNFGAAEQAAIDTYQNGKFNRSAERAVDPTDVAQRLVLSGLYELPFGKAGKSSMRAINALISGWQLNSIATIQGGLPVVVRGANNFLADRPNSTGKTAYLDERSAGRWFNPLPFTNPVNYTYGNLGRTLPDVRTPATIAVDLSIIKNTRIWERVGIQFRAEAFNLANHVNLGFPNTTFVPGADGSNRSATFGTITSSRDARIIQFGLRLAF